MNIEPLTLEAQFQVSQLERYLQQHPECSSRMAIINYKHLLRLIQKYKSLYKKYELVQSEYSEFLEILNQICDGDFRLENPDI